MSPRYWRDDWTFPNYLITRALALLRDQFELLQRLSLQFGSMCNGSLLDLVLNSYHSLSLPRSIRIHKLRYINYMSETCPRRRRKPSGRIGTLQQLVSSTRLY